MDLEKLNKSQIVLLTLLVSFVTSIATGIVAVTLMEQAPPAITQTVNRIVERTVEKVVPSTQTASAASTETIVVQESDLITEAVAKTTPIAVRLFGQGRDAQGNTAELFLGLGVVATNDGLIFADATMMSDDAVISVLRSDGVKTTARVIGRDKDVGIVRLQAATTTEEKKETETVTTPLVWTPAVFVKSPPNLGETVVVLAGKTSLKIASGIVTALVGGEGDAGSNIIETSIASDNFLIGSPLITKGGEVLGIATAGSRAAVSGGFLASPAVLSYNKPSE